MNKDLASERSASPIDVKALTYLLDGGRASTERRKELEAMVENDPVFANNSNMFMSRPERYRRGLDKARRYFELIRDRQLSAQEEDVVMESISDSLPTFIHSLMFVPNVDALCTEEQKRLWLPRCRAMEVIGCYAQTELGHGSNVRALETTATFIPATDEFEINTPSTTATKWWPGTMGRTANHAMVIAQLVLNGQSYGIHNFIVPIRGHDHLPLPGVRVGDIGPKIGFNGMDNGFCVFDHVRIPRTNMAMRYQQVDRQGRYTTSGSQEAGKIAYITLMQVRAHIVKQAGKSLAKAVIIATRYSILRRQGFIEGNEGSAQHPREHQVLDYTIQMHRLLPLLAMSYGFHFTGRMLTERLHRLEDEHVRGQPSTLGREGVKDTLKQFHAASSGLKSLCTMITAAGIEDCRKACGGHGFLQSSGIPEHLGTYLQACTVEGENHMLTQQVVRILLQELRAAVQGHDVGIDCLYIKGMLKEGNELPSRKCSARSAHDMREASILEAAFEHRAFRLLLCVQQRLGKDVAAGRTRAQAWNRALVEIYRASHAHSSLLVYKAFRREVEGIRIQGKGSSIDDTTWAGLDRLLGLLGLYWVQDDMGDFVEDGYLSGSQARWVRDQVVEVMQLIRPDAISFVDAWDLSDFQLNSAIGRYDGNVYEALMESTKRNPMNARDPVEGYEEHLEPLIRGGRERRLAQEEACGVDKSARSKL